MNIFFYISLKIELNKACLWTKFTIYFLALIICYDKGETEAARQTYFLLSFEWSKKRNGSADY